jgi:hypothetical protein
MLDALIDRKDGHVAGARQASGVVHPVQVVQDALVAIGRSKDAIHPVRARQMQELGRNGLAVVLGEVLGLVAVEGDDVVDHGRVGVHFPVYVGAPSHCRVSRQQVMTKMVRAAAVGVKATRLNARVAQPARRLCVTIDAIEVLEGTDQAFGERCFTRAKPYARVVILLVR